MKMAFRHNGGNPGRQGYSNMEKSLLWASDGSDGIRWVGGS